MLDRRSFLVLVALTGLALPPAAAGQGRVPTVAFFGPPASAGGLREAFQQGLRELGYDDGRNVRIEYRSTEVAVQGHPELFRRYIDELVALRPDVLVVSIIGAAAAAKAATHSIPIVIISVPDPVAAGLVSSLARPGGNLTGLTRETPDLIGKNVELLVAALSAPSRIGVLVDPADPLKASLLRQVTEAAQAVGVTPVIEQPRPGGADIEHAFSRLQRERITGVLVLGGAGFYLDREHIAGQALQHRLASMFQNREFVEAGGLLSYAPNTAANYRRAAVFVDKILKGANPADLPIEQPTRFELVVNRRTAGRLGITIPPTLLLRADEVIQ